MVSPQATWAASDMGCPPMRGAGGGLVRAAHTRHSGIGCDLSSPLFFFFFNRICFIIIRFGGSFHFLPLLLGK